MRKLKGIMSQNDSSEKYIGFVFGSSTPLDLLYFMAETAKDRLFVYCPIFTESQKKKLSQLDIKYSSSDELVKLNIASFKVLITMGFLPHVAHKNIIGICAAYKKIGGNIIDFQHGLYQWGINFSDTSLEQGFDQRDSIGISLPMASYADEVVTWFGTNGVGYPKATISKKSRKSGGYILIVSNTNWHIYSNEEKVKFAYLLARYIRSNPDKTFLWKPHPAEFNPKLSPVLNIITDYKLNNLNIIRHGEEGKGVADLIEACEWGIATIGTSILDFCILKKPCLIYKTPSCENLVDHFAEVSSFSNYQQISSKPCVPQLGGFKAFEAEKFWSLVMNKCKSFSYPESLLVVSEALGL